MTRWICLVAALSIAAAACSKKDDAADTEPATEPAAEPAAEPPPEPEPPKPDPALVERGKYLAALAGCKACHTPLGPQGPVMEKAWAGGLEIPEKFGTWRSPNITQDKKTGIGDWTDEQIATAIREGKRPDGSQMYPIMPYLMFNQLSDQDTEALVAFLRTIPPKENPVAGSDELALPKIPAPPPEGKMPDETDKVAYGGYLATLMHCAMCHVPQDDKGMPIMDKAFAGGFAFEIPPLGEGVMYAPNLTPHKTGVLDEYSDDELKAAIRQMKKRDGSPIMPPMALSGMEWGAMTDADADALVAFLRALPPIKNKVPKSTFKPHGPPPGAGGPPAKK